jgi:hypothetical protein
MSVSGQVGHISVGSIDAITVLDVHQPQFIGWQI